MDDVHCCYCYGGDDMLEPEYVSTLFFKGQNFSLAFFGHQMLSAEVDVG